MEHDPAKRLAEITADDDDDDDEERRADEADLEADEDGEPAICFICAESSSVWAVGPCDHRVCHVCSVRLRALFRKRDCTFCKAPHPHVVFTRSLTRPFERFSPELTPFSDPKLGILFTSERLLAQTMQLLKFNCPHAGCGVVSPGWGALKVHARQEHAGAQLCDLCVRHQRIFAHEHALYPTVKQLAAHCEREHPACEFCGSHFYDSEQLRAHCRERHEECFICARLNNGVPTLHRNYVELERHFNKEHHPCPHPDCRAQKFVVFESDLDLRAHAVDVHHVAGADQRQRKDARRVDLAAIANSTTVDERERDREQRGRRRVPGLPDPTPPPSRFNMTETNADSGGGQVDLERHTALLEQVKRAVGSDARLASFKAAVRGFHRGETSSNDLASTLYHVLGQNDELTNEIVSKVAELFAHDQDKQRDLVAAWDSLKASVRQDAFSLTH